MRYGSQKRWILLYHLMEFQFKNKLITDKELEVVLRMADEMSAEEKARIEDLLFC